MEHNFNPNKGDYKYILDEELRKANGESIREPEKKQKQPTWFARFRNYLLFTFISEVKSPT